MVKYLNKPQGDKASQIFADRFMKCLSLPNGKGKECMWKVFEDVATIQDNMLLDMSNEMRQRGGKFPFDMINSSNAIILELAKGRGTAIDDIYIDNKIDTLNHAFTAEYR